MSHEGAERAAKGRGDPEERKKPQPRCDARVTQGQVDERNLHLDRDFMARLRELFYERDVTCPDCGYCLRGVPGPRCPECGRIVSEVLREADVTPWRTPAYKRMILRKRILHLCALGAVTLGAAAGIIALGMFL